MSDEPKMGTRERVMEEFELAARHRRQRERALTPQHGDAVTISSAARTRHPERTPAMPTFQYYREQRVTFEAESFEEAQRIIQTFKLHSEDDESDDPGQLECWDDGDDGDDDGDDGDGDDTFETRYIDRVTNTWVLE